MVRMKLCLALAFSAWSLGCAAQEAQLPTSTQQTTVFDETAEGQACIDNHKAEGKAATDACRAAVKAKYDAKQAALADGGAK